MFGSIYDYDEYVKITIDNVVDENDKKFIKFADLAIFLDYSMFLNSDNTSKYFDCLYIWRVSVPEGETIIDEGEKNFKLMSANNVIFSDCQPFYDSEQLCLIIVQVYGGTLKHVEKQTDYICELAVKQNGLSLRCVKTQTEYLCELAVKNDGYALEYVQNQTERICELAVMCFGNALKYVNNQTERICELAVQQNGNALMHVKNQTERICELAVQSERFNNEALKYVKNQTERICELAVQSNGMALEFVKNQTERICELAVIKTYFALKYVRKQTPELCEIALQNCSYPDKFRFWVIKDKELRHKLMEKYAPKLYKTKNRS